MNKVKQLIMGFTAVALIVGMSAFKSAVVDYEYWHFKSGMDLTDAKTISAYEPLNSIPTPTCDGAEVPCIIRLDKDNPSTPDLSSYLSTFPNVEDVLEDAQSKRAE